MGARRGSKHGANNLEDYRRIFEAALDKAQQRGFVLEYDFTLTSLPGAIEIVGRLECPGNIFIKVEKLLRICGGNESDPLVQTVAYSYNAYVNGVGNIVRYDGPDPHRDYHHVHRYDLLNRDSNGQIFRMDEDDWPHVTDVAEEVTLWYWANMDAVDALVRARI